MGIFNKVKVKRPKRSKFNLSHEVKMSARMGKLYPVLTQEVMPGDSFKVSSEVFIRFAPLIAPVMERFYANIHYFFVPYRLVWNGWEEFITGGEDGLDTSIAPYVQLNGTNALTTFGKGTLADYLGVPSLEVLDVTPTITQKLSVLPFRCYNEIYNEYYRDQNLEQPVGNYKEGGLDNGQTQLNLLTRSWTKTYFHSALPWAQRGAEVTLPFDDVNYLDRSEVKNWTDGTPSIVQPLGVSAVGNVQGETTLTEMRIENIESIGAPTINELRKAYRLQEWLENNARGGARYIEQIASHFGVKSSDSRLQRPEYLGGGKTDVVVSTTYNTTGIVNGVDPDGDGAVQSNMSGNATSLGRTNYFKRSFEEHGIVMGIMSVLSYPSYWQGLNKMWSRFDKLDYPFPEFANLGEQEILNQEIFLGNDADNALTFGYTPRYAEFKTGFSRIAGDFKDNLDFWHYAQKYQTVPPLNANFMKYSNDNRIWNVIDQNVDNLYIQVYNNISAIRPLPYYGTPRT